MRTQPPKEKAEGEPENGCGIDEKSRGYYYDDAHGYEDFDPDEAEEEEDDESVFFTIHLPLSTIH